MESVKRVTEIISETTTAGNEQAAGAATLQDQANHLLTSSGAFILN